MRPSDGPPSLTPDERVVEVVRIFAAGILQLPARAALSPDTTGHTASEKLAGEFCHSWP